MYISRRVDIIGPPVWKSTISPHLSKSELASLRLWQSKCQQHTLSPLHHHTLTLPRYLTTPSHTQNPSDVEHDTCTTYASYIVPTLRLTADQYRTHLDLVPMPRATIYIPFLHLSYLPDPFSLTIVGNYSFLV